MVAWGLEKVMIGDRGREIEGEQDESGKKTIFGIWLPLRVADAT